MKIMNKLHHNIVRILTHYGDEQRKKAIEEMDELISELIDDINGKGNVEHIKEEIADVYVMLEQLKTMYHITDMEVVSVMNYKVNRQLERIANGL